MKIETKKYNKEQPNKQTHKKRTRPIKKNNGYKLLFLEI